MKRICFNLILTFLLIFMLSGCSHKDVTRYVYNYEGENDLWSAMYSVECTVTFTDKNGTLDVATKSNDILVITYKGSLEDLSTVKHLEISYQGSLSGGSQVSEYSEDESITTKVFKIKSGSEGGSIPVEDDVITVTIDVNGTTQSFELKNDD